MKVKDLWQLREAHIILSQLVRNAPIGTWEGNEVPSRVDANWALGTLGEMIDELMETTIK